MRLTEAKIAEMRAAAEKATPGPWSLSIFGGEPSVTVVPDEHGYSPRIACFAHFEGKNLRGEAMETANRGMRIANATLIANANPQTVLSLLDEVEALRKALTRTAGVLGDYIHAAGEIDDADRETLALARRAPDQTEAET